MFKFEMEISVVSPHKWVGNAGSAIGFMTVIQYIVAQYRDININQHWLG